MGRVWLSLALLAGLLALLGCGEQPHPSPTATPWPTPTWELVVSLPLATPRPTATPAPATPRPTYTPKPTPTPVIYVVVAGDSLVKLSEEYGVSVSDLQDANAILDPRRLQIGQELIIPQPEPTASEGAPSPTPPAYTIQGVTLHTTSAGTLWCLGEVWNTTNTALEEVQVRVTLRDDNGRPVATAEGPPALDIIAPGQRAPFVILFPNPPQSFAQYTVQPLRGMVALPGGRRYSDLAVVGDQGQAQEDEFVVVGQVRNTGQVTATARLVVTAYDAQGDVVGLRSLALADPVSPGASAPFSLTLLPVGQPVSAYSVQPEGLREG